MKTERQEELEMLIEKTRDKMVRDAEVIQHLNYKDSYKDQSFLMIYWCMWKDLKGIKMK